MSRLTTRDLNISIGKQRVCQSLDLSIEPGQVWGILGRNGAGKTTLLHTLAGLRPADSGEIFIDNTPLTQIPRKQLAKKLGLLLQQTEESFPASVMETVLTGRHPHINNWAWESRQDIEIARKALDTVQLGNMQQRQVDQLSGGERQRVNIACLIAQAPELFLLDEPNSHLDLKYQILILNYLKKLSQQNGHGVIMSLHDIQLTQRYCSHVLLIFDEGHTRAGPCDELITRDNLCELYQQPLLQIDSEIGPVFIPDTHI